MNIYKQKNNLQKNKKKNTCCALKSYIKSPSGPQAVGSPVNQQEKTKQKTNKHLNKYPLDLIC